MKCFPCSGVLYGAAFASLLLLSACGKKAPAAPAGTAVSSTNTAKAAATARRTVTGPVPLAATARPAASLALAAHGPLRVAKLAVGDAVNAEHQVTETGNRFAANDKTIYASVATEGNSGGAMLNAKWSYLEGQGQLISNISQPIATDGPAVTTFRVQNPDLWPEGKYKVEISLDGKPVVQQDFEIGKP